MATTHKMLIDGHWERGKEHISVLDKYTCEVIGEIPRATKNDVERAVDSAKRAFVSYADMPAHARAEILFRTSDLLERNKEELATLICREAGKA